MHLSFIFSAHGFGINTNILETNVLNLLVVIAVVVTFVGNALIDFLEDRKKTILDNLSVADQKAKEVQNNLNQAQAKLESAKQKAQQIQQQSLQAAKEEQALCVQQANQEAKQLKQRKDDSINLQQKKAIEQISKQIIGLSVAEAREKLTSRTKERNFQLWVNKARFVHYRTVDKYLKYLV